MRRQCNRNLIRKIANLVKRVEKQCEWVTVRSEATDVRGNRWQYMVTTQ